MEKIKIAIVDDQTLFRQLLSSLIKSDSSFELIYEEESGESFLNRLAETGLVPDVTLLDMKMPGMSGIDLNRILHLNYPETKVIVLSLFDERRLVASMIEAGARSYMEKTCDKEELITAINSVYKSGFYMNNRILNAIQSAEPNRNKPVKSLKDIPVIITKREKEILKLICQELSNAEIAEQIFLSIRTVEGHRNNLILKTGCKNTAGLVLFAVKYHIFDLTLI